jgi:hypothetical protein
MTSWKTLIVGSALALLAPLAFAQSGSDNSIGTWKLNLTKSTFGSESPPKGETRTYSQTPQGTHVVIEDELANGQKTKSEVTLTYDGKPQKLSGSPDYDAVASHRVDAYETTADLIRNGKVIGQVRRLVSKDGKTLTINQKRTKVDGTTETALSIYERQ